MGSLDNNGIYIYDDNDKVTPLATVLNLLGASTSAAFDDLLPVPLPAPQTWGPSGEFDPMAADGEWRPFNAAAGGPVSVSITLPARAWVRVSWSAIVGSGASSTTAHVDLLPHLTGASAHVPSWMGSARAINIDRAPGVSRDRVFQFQAGETTVNLMRRGEGGGSYMIRGAYLSAEPLRWV